MFHTVRLLFIFSLFLPLSSLSKTGYLNLMEAFERTNQGKKVKSRFEKESKKIQNTLKATENKLRQEEAGLQKEMALLSEQQRGPRIMKFQEKVTQFQQQAKGKELELQKLQAELTDPIIKRLKVVTGAVAKTEKYELIKNIGPDTVWVSPNLDVTNQVVKAYNKKHK